MTDLVAALYAGIERARAARRANLVLTPDALLTLAPQPTRRTPRLPPVARPQHCDCGANQLALVAHWDHCASRSTR